ncbi:MAG: hypothetical protein LBP37_06190 [Spirochaetaceae bacterium]|jgi:hypothetical protein|nr:hypothetical protein [Spirochaetaceae bacterium]
MNKIDELKAARSRTREPGAAFGRVFHAPAHKNTPRFEQAFVKSLFYQIIIILAVLFFSAGLSGCEGAYGKVGGADKTLSIRPWQSGFESALAPLAGVWYSHYAGMGRLDGYRIGKWRDFDRLMTGKSALFPGMERKTYTSQSGSDTPDDEDYFVFYDDTVYGEKDDGSGGNGGWDNVVTRYIGVVRAVNIFNGDKKRGAIIIEYLKGCAPKWDADIKNGGRPFFGIFYRVLDSNTVQMANAVNLAALYAGKKYYTETATLDEAMALNTVENEAEFISWGVVIPQDKER